LESQPELVRVLRQERRERRVQHRVHEDNGADEDEKPAHEADATDSKRAYV
jgi:hypothetical protein